MICLQVKHDFDGITTSSAGLKGLLNSLIVKFKPVSYEFLHINLTIPEKLNAEWPCVPIPEYTDDINLPTTKNLQLKLKFMHERFLYINNLPNANRE